MVASEGAPRREEVLVSGFGGQGVVRMGQILGLAAVEERLHSTMLVSHGTETRGGYERSQVVVSDGQIYSPVVEHPTVFCALSRAAYQRFYEMVGPEGTIVYDPAFVEPSSESPARQLAVPARDLAVEHFGREIFSNMVAFGQVVSLLGGLVTRDAAAAAIRQCMPKFLDENVQAFDLGLSLVP